MRRMRHGRNRTRKNSIEYARYPGVSRQDFRNRNLTRAPINPVYNRSPLATYKFKVEDAQEGKNVSRPKTQTSEQTEIKNRINSKIKDIEKKIKKQIISRRKFIANNISQEICFKKDGEELFRVNPQFIDYLVERSEKNVIQKYQFKNQLEEIRFKLEPGNEDILIANKGLISSTSQPQSLLKSEYSEWSEWKALVKLIGRNSSNYKLNEKGEKLNTLFKEYRNLTEEESEEKKVICEECGAKNPAQGLHCYYCGNKL